MSQRESIDALRKEMLRRGWSPEGVEAFIEMRHVDIRTFRCMVSRMVSPMAAKPFYRLTSKPKAEIPAELRRQVFERDAYRCVTCGGWKTLTCDHIVPESAGGPTTLENLQTMCQSCNSRKGART